MAQIVNNLYVTGTKSAPKAQLCDSEIANSPWVFSYKCCEVEKGILSKGGDYAFTLTFGNMGECSKKSFITDVLKVTEIGGVQLKIMDYCENCKGYTPFFFGFFYYPRKDEYFLGFVSLDKIIEHKLELVLCTHLNMNIFLFDEKNCTFHLPLEAHTIECLGILLQVEDIFCDTCPLFASMQGAREKSLLTEVDLQLPPQELDIKLKELKNKLNKDFKPIK